MELSKIIWQIIQTFRDLFKSGWILSSIKKSIALFEIQMNLYVVVFSKQSNCLLLNIAGEQLPDYSNYKETSLTR